MARGCGCLWVALAGLVGLTMLGSVGEEPSTPIERERADGRSPRRPLPQTDDRYEISQEEAPDSFGTAFAIGTAGTWLTADHVTATCRRLGFMGDDGMFEVRRVLESASADASIVRDGPAAATALLVAHDVPEEGAAGYHMGFPGGEPAVVVSELIGAAEARRGGSRDEPVLVWAEQERVPGSIDELGGISGGPTLDANGEAVGLNSASSDRRGRVLTTDLRALRPLMDQAGTVDAEDGWRRPLSGRQDAVRAFGELVDGGIIRRIDCHSG